MADLAAAVEAAVAPPVPEPGELMRVLVAEDDRGLREVLVQGLEEAGYFVDAVAAGDEAIDQLRFYEYDVAVVDWRMPRVSGLEVVVVGRQATTARPRC